MTESNYEKALKYLRSREKLEIKKDFESFPSYEIRAFSTPEWWNEYAPGLADYYDPITKNFYFEEHTRYHILDGLLWIKTEISDKVFERLISRPSEEKEDPNMERPYNIGDHVDFEHHSLDSFGTGTIIGIFDDPKSDDFYLWIDEDNGGLINIDLSIFTVSISRQTLQKKVEEIISNNMDADVAAKKICDLILKT